MVQPALTSISAASPAERAIFERSGCYLGLGGGAGRCFTAGPIAIDGCSGAGHTRDTCAAQRIRGIAATAGQRSRDGRAVLRRLGGVEGIQR